MTPVRAAFLSLLLLAPMPVFGAGAPHYTIASRIKVPDGGFDYATFDAGKVYMPRGLFTTVIDTATGTATRLESGASDHIALPVPGTNIMVFTQRAGGIRLADKTTDKTIADLTGGKNPNSAVYDPVTKTVFVMNKNSGDAAIVDPAAGKVVATIPVSPNTLEFPATDGQGHVFDNIETTADVVVIDTRTRKVTATYHQQGCDEPTGLAYVADRKWLVSSCGNGVAKILNADTGAEVGSVAIGKGPDAVIYDPKRHIALVPCGQDGELDVIDLNDPAHIAVTQRLKTAQGSRTGTVDPGTGKVYLMSSKPDTAAAVAPGGRVPRLAGSWEVLVISP